VSPNQLKRRAVKGAFWAILENVVVQAMALIIFVLMAKILGPARGGLILTAYMVTLLFSNTLIEGTATAIVRKADATDEDYDTCFSMCLGLSILSFLIVFAGAGAIAALLRTPQLGPILRGMSFILLFTGLSRTHTAWLMRNLQFRSLAIRSTVATTLGGAVGVGMALMGYGVASMVAQQLVQSVASTIALWVVTPWRPRLRFSLPIAKEIYAYGRHVAATGLTNFITQYSDVFFVTYLLGPAATGIYNVGKRIPNVLNSVLAGALQRVALPTFAQVQTDPDRLALAFFKAVSLSSTLSAPIFAGIGCVAPEVVDVLFGPKWSAAAPVLSLLAIVGYLTSIGYYNHSIFLASNRPHWQTFTTLIHASSTFIVYFSFAHFGLTATALAYTVRSIVIYPVSVGMALIVLGASARDYLKAIGPPLVAALAMAAVVTAGRLPLIHIPSIERLILLAALGAAAYGATMALIGRKEMREVVSTVSLLARP
jgi:O-antigen/teichoic acid export membrane protein